MQLRRPTALGAARLIGLDSGMFADADDTPERAAELALEPILPQRDAMAVCEGAYQRYLVLFDFVEVVRS